MAYRYRLELVVIKLGRCAQPGFPLGCARMRTNDSIVRPNPTQLAVRCAPTAAVATADRYSKAVRR